MGVSAFLGIPFAKPPIGDLRFKDPVPAGPLEVVHATELPGKCYQSDNLIPIPGKMSEDCLYLSIYSPDVQGSYPVMFWIHGGAYMNGVGSQYSGYVFAAMYHVVLVSINYRLGPFGFLYMGNTDAPGNQGLKDQHLALKWVHENIAKFGGDPSSITMFGESAGSSSVSQHVLSPMSKGLFHQAIMQSGSANAPWAHQSQSVARGKADDLIKNVKCDGKTGFECLKTIKPDRILEVCVTFSWIVRLF